jgi:N-acetylmuramic acid 6-phosphate etherase
MSFSPSSAPVHWQTGTIATESANPATESMDQLSTLAMLTAINQQDQQVAQAVAQALPAIAGLVDVIAQAFAIGGRLIYVGAGTSGRLGVLDASECPPTFGVDDRLVQALIAGGERALRFAVEGAEDRADLAEADVAGLNLTSADVVVGLSASGSAPYVVRALELAAAVPVFTTGSIACVPGSALTLVANHAIVVETGPEVLAGSTRLKAGTAQKLVLNMLTTGAMVKWGKTYGNRMVDVKPTNAKLRQRAIRLVASIGQVDQARAQALLVQTENQVKPAIVMGRLGCDITQAQAKLAAVGGMLSQVIGTNSGIDV